jgi:hypothetical protein
MIRTESTPIVAAKKATLTDLAVITRIGLQLPPNLKYDDWLEIGERLMLTDQAVQWAVGDWWAYGSHNYGERAASAIDPKSGENRLQRFMNYGWVARAIQPPDRREVLSWSSHEAVAALEPEIRNSILDRAVKNGWGSREVRAAVKEYKDRLAGGNKPKLSAQTPAEDAEIIEETDKAVMDSGAFGEGLAAERREKLDAYRDQNLSDAHQILMRGLDTLDKALNAENRPHLPLERLSTSRLRAMAQELTRLADEADHVQSGRWSTKSKPAPKAASTEAGAGKAAGGATPPEPASSAADDFDEIRDMPDFCRRTGDAGA